MKIMVVHNRYRSTSPSGEDRVVDQEHAALVDAGHEVRRYEARSDDIAQWPPARRLLVPAQVVWNPQAVREAVAMAAEFRPDVVHAHNLFPLLGPSVLRAFHRRGVPCVVTFHNYRVQCPSGTLFRDGAPCRDCVGKAAPFSAVRHGCYRDSSLATVPLAAATVAHRRIWQTAPSAYVFLSEAQRVELEPMGFPVERSFVKPNLVPPVRRRQAAEPMVVYVGRFVEPKGVRVLMAAWERYVTDAANPSLRLALAGAGPLEPELRSWARSRPEVEVVGLLDRPACAELVRRARVVVVPSEWPEPFGLVVPEAMAAGVAPVATAHGSFAELITDGVDGLLYPPGDAGALAAVLRQVDDDPALAERLGEQALETYARRFDAEANVVALESIYRFAVANPRPSSARAAEAATADVSRVPLTALSLSTLAHGKARHGRRDPSDFGNP